MLVQEMCADDDERKTKLIWVYVIDIDNTSQQSSETHLTSLSLI